jgi:hypothetical protein
MNRFLAFPTPAVSSFQGTQQGRCLETHLTKEKGPDSEAVCFIIYSTWEGTQSQKTQ